MLGTGSVMTAALIGLTISGKKGHGPLKNLFNKKIDVKAQNNIVSIESFQTRFGISF